MLAAERVAAWKRYCVGTDNMPPIYTLTVTPSVIRREEVTHTSVAEFDNTGTAVRFDRSSRPFYRFTMDLSLLKRAEYENLSAFHALHKGGRSFMFSGLHYGGQSDFRLVGEGDGTRTEFFIPNRHVNPSSVQMRMTQGGFGVSSVTTAFSLNPNPGIVTFDTAPTSGDRIDARWANLYRVVFEPDGWETEEFAPNVFRAELALRETQIDAPAYSTLNYGLVAFWNMDENSGQRYDMSGNGRHLIEHNTVPSSTGLMGNAAVFLQANTPGLARTSEEAFTMSSTQELTVAAWANASSITGANMMLVTKNQAAAGSREWQLRRVPSDRYVFQINDSGNAGATATANNFGDPPLDTNHLVIGFYDSRSGVCVQVNTIAVTVASADPIHKTNVITLTIGHSFDSGGLVANFWHGRIDATGIWKRRLTPQEREELYNAGNGRQAPF